MLIVCVGEGHLSHPLELTFECFFLADLVRCEGFYDRFIATTEIEKQSFLHLRPIVRFDLPKIKEVTWVLPTKCRRYFPSIKLSVGDDSRFAICLKHGLCFRTKIPHLSLSEKASLRSIDFDFDCCPLVGALQFLNIRPMNDFDTRNGAFDVCLEFGQKRINRLQTFLPRCNRDIGYIDIHRIAWHVLMKQIDGGTSVHGKILDPIDRGYDADK